MKFVDVDGHILEPFDLWAKNLEPKNKKLAMRVERDEKGLEYWSMEGKKDSFLCQGTSANLATIGKSAEWRREHIFEKHDVSWEDGRAMNRAACNPHDRVKLMDKEGIDTTFIFPSIGLTLGRIRDPNLAAAHCRVYNDWIADFCRPYPQRLIPAVILPWADASEVVKELKRTAAIGPRSLLTPSTSPNDKPYSSSYWDPVWAEYEEQDLPVCLHPATAGTSVGSALYPDMITPSWWVFTKGALDIQVSFLTFFQGAVFDRFLNLKLMVLESGAAWMPYLLHRMDEKFKILGFTTPMKHKPSDYFHRQGWIDMDPDDDLGANTITLLGADKLMWAFDYPHSDSPLDPVKHLKKSLEGFPPEDQRKVAGENAINLWHLPVAH